MIQKARETSRLDVSMQLIRDNRYEIRDTRWRFNFVNSINQLIYFTQVHHISITQSQFQLRSRQALFPASRRCLPLSRCTRRAADYESPYEVTTKQQTIALAEAEHLRLELFRSSPRVGLRTFLGGSPQTRKRRPSAGVWSMGILERGSDLRHDLGELLFHTFLLRARAFLEHILVLHWAGRAET
jgi:hypothetical protein